MNFKFVHIFLKRIFVVGILCGLACAGDKGYNYFYDEKKKTEYAIERLTAFGEYGDTLKYISMMKARAEKYWAEIKSTTTI